MKTKKVQWRKNGMAIGFAYFEGNICSLEEKQADSLTEAGYVVPMPDDIELPNNFPGRKAILEAGITEIEELKAYTEEQLLAINGISKSVAQKIIEALKKF